MPKLIISLIIASFFFANAFAQEMKVNSVSAEMYQIPVLKGNDKNVVFQLNVETSGTANALTLNEINFRIKGPAEQIEVFQGNTTDDKLFGASNSIETSCAVKGKQVLKEGENIFLVSVKPGANANLLDSLILICGHVVISGKKYEPTYKNKVDNFRLGIALRKHNDSGVDTYRIPGLATTNNGTLIAVFDIRKNSETDLQEDIDVGMRRSTDGGQSWEPMQVIMDMGEWGNKPQIENGIGDPSILVDRNTNTIWVAAVWAHGHPGKRNWFASKPGLTPTETSQFMLVKSEDDGQTWSAPINITQQVKDPNWHLLLQGPGKGITMQDGTLVFPAQFKDANEIPWSTIIWSKDHGETWQIGNGAKSHTTEAQVIELKNGSLMLNMRDDRNRSNNTSENGRAVCVSSDLGKTWQQHPTSNSVLQEPNCMASLIKESFEIDGKMRDLVLFSNPNSKMNRDSITIKVSFDDGKNWPSEYHFLLDAKAGRGYSCMTKIDDTHIGILYESSQADLAFQIVPIEKILTQNKQLSYLFKSGAEGYQTFRIPAIVSTNSGRLLAFAEGRVNGSSDTGNIDLVMKSSDDGGKTWSPLKVIWDDKENVCGNPAPVVDAETGEIHLLMTWNLGSDHERDIIDLKSQNTRRVFVSKSADDGNSWTTPKEITQTTKQKNWTWYATGPCHGIQIRKGEYKGRLIIPCDHIEAGTKHYYSHVIYSDNHGKTWQLGGRAPQHQVNECTVAELNNGALLLNMRNYDRNQKSRKVSYSYDGGLSWSDLRSDSSLIEPICQASLLSDPETGILWFSNPANTDSRINMVLKCSEDEGKSWKPFKVLYSGASAYSDLTNYGKDKIACLFEAGMFSPYEGIVFQIINSKK